jgi:hypothetical protein
MVKNDLKIGPIKKTCQIEVKNLNYLTDFTNKLIFLLNKTISKKKLSR